MHMDNMVVGSGDAPDGRKQQPLDPCAVKPGGLRLGSSSPAASRAVNPGGTFLDAAVVAEELLLPLSKLRTMAKRGQYPPLLEVAPRCYRVRRADHEAWMASRWTQAVEARAELLWHQIRDRLRSSRA